MVFIDDATNKNEWLKPEKNRGGLQIHIAIQFITSGFNWLRITRFPLSFIKEYELHLKHNLQIKNTYVKLNRA